MSEYPLRTPYLDNQIVNGPRECKVELDALKAFTNILMGQKTQSDESKADEPKADEQKEETNVELVPPVHKFVVKAEVEFLVRAHTLTSAYKEFEQLIINLFNNAYDGGVKEPVIAPCNYHGMSIIKES